MKTLDEKNIRNWWDLFDNWKSQFYNEYGSITVRVEISDNAKWIHVEACHDMADISHVDYTESYEDFVTEVVLYNLYN